MTLEEAIKHAEAAAIENEKEAKRKREHGGWFYDNEARAAAICAEENGQLAEWLRELQERRKQPEIIRCGECRWYGRANKQRFYRGMDCLQRRMSTVVPDKDFCSKAERAERRTDD